MFSHVEALLSLSVELLCRLRQAIDGWDTRLFASEVFSVLRPYFRIYIEYVNQFDVIQQSVDQCQLSPAFREIQQTCKAVPDYPRHDDLASLLITPVQRMPRYILLLDRLLGLTPSGHREHEILVSAVRDVTEITTIINKRKKILYMQVRGPLRLLRRA